MVNEEKDIAHVARRALHQRLDLHRGVPRPTGSGCPMTPTITMSWQTRCLPAAARLPSRSRCRGCQPIPSSGGPPGHDLSTSPQGQRHLLGRLGQPAQPVQQTSGLRRSSVSGPQASSLVALSMGVRWQWWSSVVLAVRMAVRSPPDCQLGESARPVGGLRGPIVSNVLQRRTSIARVVTVAGWRRMIT